jgi:hypothetical protein
MSSRRASSAVVALVAASSVARADDGATLALSPRLGVTVTNGQQAIEAGVEYAIGERDPIIDTQGPPVPPPRLTGRVFATLATPFGDGTVVRIDKDTSTWRAKLGGDVLIKDRREPGDDQAADLSWARYGIAGSAGRAEYGYFPGGGFDKAVDERWSLSASARAIWVHAQAGERWAPQLELTYDRTYTASRAITVVGPARPGVAGLVSRTISLAPPSATPTLIARFSLPFSPRPSSQILIGPSLGHAFAGGDGGLSPLSGEHGRLDAELWIYYFPKQAGLTNVRLGVAPFLSTLTYGDDGADRTSFGALAELRISTELYEH